MTSPPRVLHLCPEFPPAASGIGDYAHWLTEGLAQSGFDMRVLTSARVAHWDRRMWRAVADEVRSFRPDVLHIEYQYVMYGGDPAIAWLPSVLRVRRLRPFVVTTLHDMTPPTRGPRWARRLAFEALLRGSDRLIVTSEGSRRGLARRPGMSRRTAMVSVGSNIQVHPITAEERRTLRASISSDPNAPLVVCFGLIRRGKGLEVLIDAAAALHAQSIPVELALVGDVGGAELAVRHAYRAQLLEQRRHLGLENQVHFLGHLAKDKVSAVLQSADLAVLPFLEGVSAGHTTALAILDHGLPLITTKSASTPPEYAEAMRLIDAPPDGLKLAGAIADLLHDPARGAVVVAKGKELAALHRRDSIIDRIADIYKEGIRREITLNADQAPKTPTAMLPLK